MLFLIRARSMNQLAQKCFCEESIVYAQNTVVSRRYNSSFQAKYYFISQTPLNRISATQFPHVLIKTPPVSMTAPTNYSTSKESSEVPEATTLSKKDKLKRAVKDYGATVIIFHVTISLMSLGLSYLVISSGVDVGSLLDKAGFKSTNDLATGASTFVVAYAVHKVFAPVRISITLGCTPFIVRYLRRVGVLKPPKPSNS